MIYLSHKYDVYRMGNGQFMLSTMGTIKKTVPRRKMTRKKRVESVKNSATHWKRTIRNARRLRIMSIACIALAALMNQPELIVLSIMLFAFILAITT